MDGGPRSLQRQLHCAHGMGGRFRHSGSTTSQSVAEHERCSAGRCETGTVRNVHEDRDKAWVEVGDDLRWIGGGKQFLWISEQDGWRHIYVISRDGKQQR